MSVLIEFLSESLRIEGIHRAPTEDERSATEHFISLPQLTVHDTAWLVDIYEPGAKIRDRVGMDVRVGQHVPRGGGRDLPEELATILRHASHRDPRLSEPWRIHLRYETLHPFTDGNGRSGRTIWLWGRVRLGLPIPPSFLHQFYYETLQLSRAP